MEVPERVDLREAFKTPEDLKKLAGVTSELVRKKAVIDEHLRLKREEMHGMVESGLGSLGTAQQIMIRIKEEMMNVEKLGGEAQALIEKFPKIREVATMQRNFQAVLQMKEDLETFQDHRVVINRWVEEDEQDLEEQPNLLKIHFALSKLREITNEAFDQARAPQAESWVEGELLGIFKGLDETIDNFNYNLGCIMGSMIELAQKSKDGIIVRMAIVINEEEKRDDRIKELRQARDEYKDLASRFKSLAVGTREPRGYKDLLLQAIQARAAAQMNATDEDFMSDPDKLSKLLNWYYTDINTAKQGLVNLVPQTWKIFETYVQIYHQVLYDWLQRKIEDSAVTPVHMLAIIHFKDKHYDTMMRKMKAPPRILEPPLPGGRDSDLVREYRQLITDKVEQWMSRLNSTDHKLFRNRSVDELDHDEREYFRTKSSRDLWDMLRQQLEVAADSKLPEVVEGVVDAMLRALKTRQEAWSKLLSDLKEAVSRPDFDRNNAEHLFDWLIAIANDSLAFIHDESPGAPARLTTFRSDYEALVSQDYTSAAESRFENVKDGYTDLMLTCITTFTTLIFALDLQPTLNEMFTPVWLNQHQQTALICDALSSYLGDYLPRMPDLLGELIVQEMGKQLLGGYLSSIRNRNAKYRRAELFTDRVKEDVEEVFKMFKIHESAFTEIREQWRAVNGMVQLLECAKADIAPEFESFLEFYWDVKLGWVEAVLRAREDVEFGPLGDGKSMMKQLRAIAANKRGEGAAVTIFSWVD